MTRPAGLLRHAKNLTALLLVFGLYWSARLPGVPGSEAAELSRRFTFTKVPLPEVAPGSNRTVRAVHPSLQRISAWVSSVGASIALNDLDSDGLSNDACYVDPRTDHVIVTPAHGAARFETFTLHPAPLPYDGKTMAPMGCLPGDLTEDGLVDLVVYYWGRAPVAFLRRSGREPLSRPAYAAVELVPGGERWYANAATLADLDGDGHLDLIVGNYFPDGSRILDASAAGIEPMPHSMSRAANGGRNRMLLFRHATSGAHPTIRFEDVPTGLPEHLSHGWTLALGAFDIDGDLLPDLYVANDFGPDLLLHNRSTPGQLRFVPLYGRKTLTVPNSKVLGRDSFKGMGVDFGDLNGDGRLDIYVSNIAAEYALEESHFAFVSAGDPHRVREGVAPFTDRSEPLGLSRSGWGWDARMADFDNDGVPEVVQATGFLKGSVNRWPELHELAMGNDELLADPRAWPRFQPGDDLSGRQHNPFFVRTSNGRYADIAPAIGLGDPQVTRGIAVADVDGDGRLDFAVGNQWSESYLYVSRAAGVGRFLELHLLLPPGGEAWNETRTHPGHPIGERIRAAIGATATVRLPDGRTLVGQVDGGSGHSGKRSHEIHFGLGRVAADTRVQVDVGWRDGHGRVRRVTLSLSPGRHTVRLAG